MLSYRRQIKMIWSLHHHHHAFEGAAGIALFGRGGEW